RSNRKSVSRISKNFLREIDANQKVTDKVKENYTGRRATEETQFDASGKITKVERQEHTFFYLSDEEISSLVGEDGKPLSAEKQAKQNEITKKRIEEVQKKQNKKEEKEKKAQEAKLEKDKEEQNKDDKDKGEPGIEL